MGIDGETRSSAVIVMTRDIMLERTAFNCSVTLSQELIAVCIVDLAEKQVVLGE